jgi:hypothetical protein
MQIRTLPESERVKTRTGERRSQLKPLLAVKILGDPGCTRRAAPVLETCY